MMLLKIFVHEVFKVYLNNIFLRLRRFFRKERKIVKSEIYINTTHEF